MAVKQTPNIHNTRQFKNLHKQEKIAEKIFGTEYRKEIYKEIGRKTCIESLFQIIIKKNYKTHQQVNFEVQLTAISYSCNFLKFRYAHKTNIE